MFDNVGIVVILAGLILLFGGAVLSVYGVALLGALVGGGLGSLVGPFIGDAVGLDGTIALAVGVIVGGLAGIFIAIALLKWAIAIFALIVGTYFGAVIVSPAILDVAWYLDISVGIAIGFVMAAISLVMTSSILIIISSLAGATLVTGRVTFDNIADSVASTSLEPLTFELVDPVFLGLVALGLLSQFGLFRITSIPRYFARLPMARRVSNEEPGAEGPLR